MDMMKAAAEKPKVSVVIAAYNSEKYLDQTLKSILGQTLNDIEVICVDDGSTDNTFSALKKYETEDSRVSVYQNLKSSDGAAMARNIGISYAEGEFLSVLDADDFFEPDMLERMYERAVSVKADVVLCDGWVFDEAIVADKESDFILRREYIPEGKDTFHPSENSGQLFLMTCGAAWNGLFRRKFIEDNKIQFQNFHHADDLGFVYLAYACADKISVISDFLLHYRKNSGISQADRVYQWPDSGLCALKNLKDHLEKRNLFELYKASFAQLVMLYSGFYLDHMRSWKDYRFIYNSLKEEMLDSFGVNDIEKNSFANKYWVLIRDSINQLPADEFLFRKTRGLPPFQSKSVWKRKIIPGMKLVVYGAGNIGTEVFCDIIKSKRFCLEAWVDKNYKSLGFPVRSPEIVKTATFDRILVAIVSPRVFGKVRRYLKEFGVEDEKIVWIGEEE